MNIQPSIDLKKVNLQTAVGYLVSLHENEYQWNLLGVRVVGVAATEADIPEGTYEYGDAYEVGTEPPYDLYIYTRPDGNVHTEGYWFPIGKFPMPGPQGPKGDGLEQINTLSDGTIKSMAYYQGKGTEITSDASVSYKDSTTGEDKTQHFTMVSNLPIVPGNYIYMSPSGKKSMKIEVDDKALALDYIKLDRTKTSVIPQNNSGKVTWVPTSVSATANSIPQRDAEGDCCFRELNFEFVNFKNGGSPMFYYDIYNNTLGSDYFIGKTPTNTGTLTNSQLAVLQNETQSKNLRIVYDNQVYYRTHQQNPANRTLNYIHLDSIDDGNGGYKATGKLFSVTVSTRAWKVVDLDFGGSTRTTHNLTLTNSSTGMNIYFSLTNNRPETYEGAPAGLLEALGNSPIACTVDANGTYSAGMITTDGTNFKATYGNGEEALIEQMQVSITDSMV